MQDLEKLFLSAVAAHKAGDLNAAERIYQRVLEARPEQFDTLNALGHLELQRGRLNEAYALLTRALKLNPRSTELLANRGNISLELGRIEEAIQDYDKALAVDPAGLTAMMNRGSALAKLHRHAEALASYDRVLATKPSFAPAHYNRGNVLLDLQRLEEAEQSYRRAIAIKPDYAEALNNLGESLGRLDRSQEALQTYDSALAIRPDFADALSNRANVLQDIGQHDDAAAGFRQAVKIDPDNRYALGALTLSELHVCDWREYAAKVERLSACVRASKRVAEPMVLTAVSDVAEEQYLCARFWITDHYSPAPAPIWKGEQFRHPEIRLAYISADFREHAVAFAIAQVIEQHDRTRFHTIGVSSRSAPTSGMQARLRQAFGTFIDAQGKSDVEVATLLRDREVDIVVDLGGHTRGARPGIFALRPAPIQVNYLGYPGTTGADFMDYVLADRIVIPEGHEACYSEKIVRLPDTYLPSDSRRKSAERTPTRVELGLPEAGFVFCSFNGNYKIRPDVFDIWMRLLGKVQGSVLWLKASNASASRNLRAEASKRGIAPERLIFAPDAGLEEHLARHRQANLFLDTLPYNAHSTAGDALWAGLPVLTCMGSTFAGRVAASLLHAVGLPELVAGSLEEYEQRALDLANTPALLASVRAKLSVNRTTHALFDTDRFRRHLESAYITMRERHRRGDRPANFAVEPVER